MRKQFSFVTLVVLRGTTGAQLTLLLPTPVTTNSHFDMKTLSTVACVKSHYRFQWRIYIQ